jgi:hypothetical protein
VIGIGRKIFTASCAHIRKRLVSHRMGNLISPSSDTVVSVFYRSTHYEKICVMSVNLLLSPTTGDSYNLFCKSITPLNGSIGPTGATGPAGESGIPNYLLDASRTEGVVSTSLSTFASVTPTIPGSYLVSFCFQVAAPEADTLTIYSATAFDYTQYIPASAQGTIVSGQGFIASWTSGPIELDLAAGIDGNISVYTDSSPIIFTALLITT